MNDLESARQRWLKERPAFERAGKEFAARLAQSVRSAGIWAEISSRAKDVDSLIKKLIKKPQYGYASLGDKAGVRVIVRYKGELGTVLQLAKQLFDCSDLDDKVHSLNFDQVGYLSTHVDIRLRANDSRTADFPPQTFRAELQIRTMAQHLWSEMSHDTFYKNDDTLNPLPSAVKRRIFVLSGVVELADDEFDRVNSQMPSVPEVLLLKSLERSYFTFSSRRGDPEISLDIIRLLAPLYNCELQQIVNRLYAFCSSHQDVLRDVYDQAADLPERSAFLYQPEALMIYDCLETDPLGTREAWSARYPERELERLANAFGISFD